MREKFGTGERTLLALFLASVPLSILVKAAAIAAMNKAVSAKEWRTQCV
jgi:hypothetical protein